jgi:hypothetical protein
MDTNTLLIILIALAALVILGLGAMYISRRRHSAELREKFGPEYDYTLDQLGDRKSAETELESREKRLDNLEIRKLQAEERDIFQREWKDIQSKFVDEPAEAVREADRLIKEIMQARGFPVANFEQRAADISVVYPEVVPNYRDARRIAEKNERDGAETEELRQALVYYRSLFEQLLESKEAVLKEKTR